MEFSIRLIISDTLERMKERKFALFTAAFPLVVGFGAALLFYGLLFQTLSPMADPADPQPPSGGSFLYGLITFLVIGLMFMKTIINFHRVYILDETVGLIDNFKWRRCETLFFKASTKLFILYILLGFLTVFLVFPVISVDPATQGQDGSAFLFVGILIQVGFGYLASRVSLVLPSAATDERVSIAEAWKKSGPYHGKLFVLIGVIPFLTSIGISLLPQFESIVFFALIAVIWCVVAVIELGLLSLSWERIKQLSTNSEPPNIEEEVTISS